MVRMGNHWLRREPDDQRVWKRCDTHFLDSNDCAAGKRRSAAIVVIDRRRFDKVLERPPPS